MGLSAAVVGAAAAAYGAKTAHDASQEQKSANKKAEANAAKAATAADQANGAANQRSTDGAGLLSSNAAAAQGGQAGTLLTGVGGVDNSLLTLGKSTLLGGGG